MCGNIENVIFLGSESASAAYAPVSSIIMASCIFFAALGQWEQRALKSFH
ncbi:hypothetical protein GPUN_2648 [Glaciecola punicea ACAM 611]|uniref:Uncharacterized protein n=1 Tax=Glaciecola punicea ACAM 611 TaxID=1121923 RepID=H5TEN5_9ALTE|nr:hypothetical protein GPUN_2648 [Glaciecola punicea ACAM 611]